MIVMTDKYIELLRIQMAKLEEADFDLEAWKSGSIVLLSRIFGDSSSKLTQLEKIKFDFSSWSLRDSTGSRDQMESCKKRCKGILEASTIELEVLGPLVGLGTHLHLPGEIDDGENDSGGAKQFTYGADHGPIHLRRSPNLWC